MLFIFTAWVLFLKDKKGIIINNVLQKILDKSDCKPNKILVDWNSEFCKRLMKSWLHDNDIEIYSIKNIETCVVAERFIKTLKSKIYKHMTVVQKMC